MLLHRHSIFQGIVDLCSHAPLPFSAIENMLRFCTLFEIAAIQTSPLMKQRGGKKSVGLRMRFPCGAFQKAVCFA